MGLRIHFSPEDIAKTTVAEEPDPLWEVLLSLHLLQNRDGAVVFDRWRQQARTSRQLPRLIALTPPRGYSPDFLTPAEGVDGSEAGVEAMLRTPKSRLTTELGKLNTKRRLPNWGHDLGAGNGATRARVLTAADGCTTTDLGARVGISAASASYHATILRNAGLLATKRIGSAVRHTRSELGQRLLDNADPRP